jgi:hypothetical protein
MKKLARLAWIERTFGKEFILPYRACLTRSEVFEAIVGFELVKKTWGIRTDFPNGASQGFNLPFIHHGTPQKAQELWDQYGNKLIYIVVENVLRRRYSAVAVRIDAEHLYIEWNDKEPEISQRDMYKRLENLRRIAVGPNNLVFPWPGGDPVRSVRPEYVRDLKFDQIYDVMIHDPDIKETTFTLREDGKLVVW